MATMHDNQNAPGFSNLAFVRSPVVPSHDHNHCNKKTDREKEKSHPTRENGKTTNFFASDPRLFPTTSLFKNNKDPRHDASSQPMRATEFSTVVGKSLVALGQYFEVLGFVFAKSKALVGRIFHRYSLRPQVQ